MKSILAFAGSYSSNSINQMLVTYAANLAQTTKVNIILLRQYPLPIYSWDLEQEGFPSELLALRKLFDQADGFLIAVPEYNSSMPAAFKNTIDWISRLEGKPLQDKPVLLLSASSGARGGASVQQHLLRVLPFWGAKLTGSFSLPRFKDNFADNQLTGEYLQGLQAAVAALENATDLDLPASDS